MLESAGMAAVEEAPRHAVCVNVLCLGLGIERQYFYGTDWTASILSSTEKRQVTKW